MGKLQARRLLELAVTAKVTCSCFQGRCLTKETCVNDDGGWRATGAGHRSSEHHGNRKEVLQKVIAA